MKYVIYLFLFSTFGCVRTAPLGLEGNAQKESFRGIHRKIAILPYESLEQKQFFLTLAEQVNKGRQEVSVQSYIETNRILKDKGIEKEGFDSSELGQVLGVDAIIICKSSLEESVGGRDVVTTVFCSIYDTKTLKLVWDEKTEVSSKYNLGEIRPSMVRRGILALVKELPY
ncbi:hypothetical protein [Arcticibacterium luteifluviistationis]|uniref:DUF4136 domain-containing protein n=1 Tax=Arcticibacterium luteifluviistationis TaxID=1784714 RepID=A0A2Z4GDU3_9BACT|nr:hypothetical protein [Arcticibacterium luteifluviistationis]AWV99310.1 hypothetical protein DJ013_14500 [Arcticibacterium luteifluviistationis]